MVFQVGIICGNTITILEGNFLNPYQKPVTLIQVFVYFSKIRAFVLNFKGLR